jgi:uncharacterized membrane protein
MIISIHKIKKERGKENMKKYIPIIITGVIILSVIALAIFLNGGGESAKDTQNLVVNTAKNSVSNSTKNNTKAVSEIEKDEQGNAIINKEGITSQATFYTYTVDGVKIRIFAVKASDGSIRTAFNTCQVCNPSPLAYFVQKGSNFECQNCKNLFATNKIGIEKGGCNPIPITTEERQENNDKIVISKSLIEQHKENFETIE